MIVDTHPPLPFTVNYPTPSSSIVVGINIIGTVDISCDIEEYGISHY
jgi:hypothetical protein